MSDSGYSGTTASGKIAFSDSQSNKPSNKSAVDQHNKLLEATKTGDLPEVERLMEECQVEPGSCLEDNLHRDTLLHLAAFHGRLNVVKYLVENKTLEGRDATTCKVGISFSGAVANTPLEDSIRLLPRECKQSCIYAPLLL